ncbi:hypothetical protein [Acinetobacter lwoffii]|uniref:hypothetical protein n=1 Tax=Acinetobacter lwoffii TaxID=28090 RepID=UPI003426AFE1
MATDVDVHFFSHLNGLTLGNNWGDLIRLLDKALVTGIDFTPITAASVDEQGDIHITLYAAHNAMLFQVVELSGFTPTSLNQKYRIKGVPNTTQLILKPAVDIAERSITTIGMGKLGSLGYEIIFRDTGDVKRVYRAKDPSAQHPFIRVDESLTSLDGTTGVYTSTYAKYAMVGLLEHMEHIDDYENPDVLQLPFDPTDPAKNWKITGIGNSVVRGWSRWYWTASDVLLNNPADQGSSASGNRHFTLIGCADYFYLINPTNLNMQYKTIKGCGLFDATTESDVIPNWFLISLETTVAASSTSKGEITGSLFHSLNRSKFSIPKYATVAQLSLSTKANPILPDYRSGERSLNTMTASDTPALQIPFYDDDRVLRGTLPAVHYAGKQINEMLITTPILSGSSMYVWESHANNSGGGALYYIGELE